MLYIQVIWIHTWSTLLFRRQVPGAWFEMLYQVRGACIMICSSFLREAVSRIHVVAATAGVMSIVRGTVSYLDFSFTFGTFNVLFWYKNLGGESIGDMSMQEPLMHLERWSWWSHVSWHAVSRRATLIRRWRRTRLPSQVIYTIFDVQPFVQSLSWPKYSVLVAHVTPSPLFSLSASALSFRSAYAQKKLLSKAISEPSI